LDLPFTLEIVQVHIAAIRRKTLRLLYDFLIREDEMKEGDFGGREIAKVD